MAQLCYNPNGAQAKVRGTDVTQPASPQPAPAASSPEEAAYWAAPASTRQFMTPPGSAEWNRRQADQVVNDRQFADAGITDPFEYALRGGARPTPTAPRTATPQSAAAPAPYVQTGAPGPGADVSTLPATPSPYVQTGVPKAGGGMVTPQNRPDLTLPTGLERGMVGGNMSPGGYQHQWGMVTPQGMGQPPAGMGMNNFSPVQLPSQAPTTQPLMPPSFGVTQQQPTQQGSVLGQMTPKPYQPTNFSPAPRTTQAPGAPAGGGYRSNPAFAAYSRRRGL